MSAANGSISLSELLAEVDRLKRELQDLKDLGKEHQRDYVQPLEEIVEKGRGDVVSDQQDCQGNAGVRGYCRFAQNR